MCFTIQSWCHLLWIRTATALIITNKKEKKNKFTIKNKQEFVNNWDRSKKSCAKILMNFRPKFYLRAPLWKNDKTDNNNDAGDNNNKNNNNNNNNNSRKLLVIWQMRGGTEVKHRLEMSNKLQETCSLIYIHWRVLKD